MGFCVGFSHSPHDQRVWFDAIMGMWRVCRWDQIGGIVSAKHFETNHLAFQTEGQFMRFSKSVVQIGGTVYEFDSDVTAEYMRLMPAPINIEMPVVAVARPRSLATR